MEQEIEAILRSLESRKDEDANGGLPSFPEVQHTLAVIKGEIMEKAGDILNIIEREGLAILQSRRVQLSPEQAAQFYQDMYEMDFFAESVKTLSDGPILALVLGGPNAITRWHNLIHGVTESPEKECPRPLLELFGPNSVHGSASEEDAVRELRFFFPELIIHPLMSDEHSILYLNDHVHPTLTVGLSKLVREKPEDPLIWLGDWLLENNPNKPQGDVELCQN